MGQEAPKPDKPTPDGSKPDKARSAQDFLEIELPYQLSEIARRVCVAGTENPDLAIASLQQVEKILKAAVGQGERDILALLALKLAGTPGADGSDGLAEKALHDIEPLLCMQGQFGPLVPALPISVFAVRLQEVAAELLAQEEPAKKTTRAIARPLVLSEDRATLREVAQKYELDLEAFRAAVKIAADEGKDLGRTGRSLKTSYDRAMLEVFAQVLKETRPGVKKK